tara:strand:- start:1230 stop:1838 length:609 start_codon:yes stop_codon:yes gene_type:complete
MVELDTRTDFLKYMSSVIPRDSVCVEVGVLDGEFSAEILEHIKPKKLYLIDPWKTGSDKNGKQRRYYGPNANIKTAYSNQRRLDLVKNRFSEEISKGQVELKRGFSYEVIDEFPDNYFDFVYIDACHLYDCVKADLNMFYPKLISSGSFMCGHDYADQEKNRTYVRSNFGVVQAVDEFVSQHSLKWEAKMTGEPFQDWALRR